MRTNWSTPPEYERKPIAFSIWELVVLVALVTLVVVILLPSRGGNHILSSRSVCAANLRGIAQSIMVYAGENGGAFPTVAYAPYVTVGGTPKGITSGTNDLVKARERYYSAPNPQAGSVPACLWILVMNDQLEARQFMCKSDPFAGKSPAATHDAKGIFYDNFQNGRQLSYSMAYPWKADGTVGAWWKNTEDAELPILADMNPLNGTGKPKRNMTPAAEPKDSATWNSGNHMGDGQNVAFADGHAEFCRRPDVGQNNDNIYTMSAVPSRGPGQFGGVAAGMAPAGAPQLTAEKGPFDVIMLPVRNETTGGM
jgi:prepilin-type processing-associated H-X9-DG protein